MKFRPWLMLSEANQQETQALKIIGGDENVLVQLKSISPEPKFLPLLALLHKEQPNLATLKTDWPVGRTRLFNEFPWVSARVKICGEKG